MIKVWAPSKRKTRTGKAHWNRKNRNFLQSLKSSAETVLPSPLCNLRRDENVPAYKWRSVQQVCRRPNYFCDRKLKTETQSSLKLRHVCQLSKKNLSNEENKEFQNRAERLFLELNRPNRRDPIRKWSRIPVCLKFFSEWTKRLFPHVQSCSNWNENKQIDEFCFHSIRWRLHRLLAAFGCSPFVWKSSWFSVIMLFFAFVIFNSREKWFEKMKLRSDFIRRSHEMRNFESFLDKRERITFTVKACASLRSYYHRPFSLSLSVRM